MKKDIVTLEEILKMDATSEEFFNIFVQMHEKYWNVDDNSDYIVSCKLLTAFVMKGMPDHVIATSKIINEIIHMDENKNAVSGHIVFDKIQYYFDIYTSEVQKDKLAGIMRKALKGLEKKINNKVGE
jgi:hypothetical protein